MLQVSEHAPDFVLPDVEGNAEALDTAGSELTLAIFFKTSCPTCQYAWKFYERLHKTYANAGLRVLGISQHDAKKTIDFRARYDATFPHLIDTEFAASRVYDPAFVPTGFLIDRQGTIVETFESWNSRRLNDLSHRIAKTLGSAEQKIVTPQDNAIENKIG